MVGHKIIMLVNCRILACFYAEECAIFKFPPELGEYGFCIVLSEPILKTVMSSCVWFCLQNVLRKCVSMVVWKYQVQEVVVLL